MRVLLNHPWLSYVAAISVSAILMLIRPIRSVLVHLAYGQAPTLVGVTVSLLGFVIAALAIVIAVQDRGLVSELRAERGVLWHQLMAVFASTSKVVGLAALGFILIASLDAATSVAILSYVVAYIFFVLLIAVGLQVAKVIHVLEKVGSLAGGLD